MNIITVKINGMEYNLKGEENDEYLHMVAKFVDKRIRTLMENNSKLGSGDATILAALNMGDELLKNKESYERLSENYTKAANDNKVLISELEQMKKQIESLENINKELKEQVENLSDNQDLRLKEEMQKIDSEMEVMTEVSNEIKSENEKLTMLNKKLAARNRELRSDICDKTRNIKELAKELDNKNEELIKEKLKKNPLLKIKE
ncbi:cell division ZapA family protein [Clostridium argentinense CDC 2741]|uniref:Cell division protein ZapA n=1 Tax=Clostridium argentinense CDC 2741 TaxID=1418104 RepID=A0A0C1UK63_9CLOT|nr:cell division protein ZapA [Clostridium argentinense]ARC84476.1 cell division protein ZapA [Clostridium argentinense]KIE47675.1 cell division ZapA family protein [Clostridium argentinense CDC 2741]NFF38741.1 cell division protein ZapA [Clostridium argentinense]NFP48966.1 cell division protein ZapA [Clostridium argentinense]NFP72577.1 cell division protein ZapA [Clostridium argentinense]